MENRLHQLKRQAKIWVRNGCHLSGGSDNTDYPIHHFHYNYNKKQISGKPLRVIFSGRDEWRGDGFRFRESSDIFSVELVTQGAFLYEQRQREYVVRPGELFLVHHNQDSCMSTLDGSFSEKWTVAMEGILLSPLLASLGLSEIDVMPISNSPLLCELIQTITKHVIDGRPSEYLAYQLLLLLSEELSTHTIPFQMREMIQYLENHLDDQIKMDNLVCQFNMSASSIHRMFRFYTGKAPMTYLIQMRMNAAEQLLRLSDLSIKCIAVQTGFSDPLYFSSEFRKYSGMSPSDFRRQKI